MSDDFRSGFVGLIGRPNVGKSTILNHFVGSKVAITSPQPQTTRQRIAGVATRERAQAIFLDTPGWHQPEHPLGRFMIESAKAVMQEADVLVMVIDARRGITAEDERVLDHVKRMDKPRLLAINKVDAVRKPLLLPLLAACGERKLFEECIPISALKGDQMDVLLERIIARLPTGPRWYEPGQLTDQSNNQLVSEFIREQVLMATRAEVPHAVAVMLEEIKEGPRVLEIQASILVEREGQKAILIGKGGTMLKKIGQAAREQIEKLLGRHVYLGLWVKVVEDWRSNPRVLRELGYQA